MSVDTRACTENRRKKPKIADNNINKTIWMRMWISHCENRNKRKIRREENESIERNREHLNKERQIMSKSEVCHWIIYDVFKITHITQWVAECCKTFNQRKNAKPSEIIICVHNPNNKLNDAYARPYVRLLLLLLLLLLPLLLHPPLPPSYENPVYCRKFQIVEQFRMTCIHSNQWLWTKARSCTNS